MIYILIIFGEIKEQRHSLNGVEEMDKLKILFDSGCDLSEEQAKKLNAEIVPLTIRVEDKIFTDDYNMDTSELIESVKNVSDTSNPPGTACPSPDDFKSKFIDDGMNFVVTLSEKLSGSYNSAMVAKNIFAEESPETYVDIIDSKSAACGEALVSIEINRLAELGLSPEEISEKIRQYVDNMKTYFMIDSMENLMKTGRISTMKGKVAQFLSIVPIMKANDGAIEQASKVRGAKNAFQKLVEIIGEQSEDAEEKILGISHCNALDKAKDLRDKVKELYKFKDIIIFETRGIATFYAGEGGIIVSF